MIEYIASLSLDIFQAIIFMGDKNDNQSQYFVLIMGDLNDAGTIITDLCYRLRKDS